jgi:uncharacterized damage-inducible protein DinB
MYDYNQWATERLLDTAAKAGEADLKAPQNAGYLPVLATFTHILLAQTGWLSFWRTGKPSERSFGDAFQSLSGVRAALAESHRELGEFLGGLSEEQIATTITITDRTGSSYGRELGPLIVHVFNHGTFHRGEIALRLSELGHSPGDLDYLDWLYP